MRGATGEEFIDGLAQLTINRALIVPTTGWLATGATILSCARMLIKQILANLVLCGAKYLQVIERSCARKNSLPHLRDELLRIEFRPLFRVIAMDLPSS